MVKAHTYHKDRLKALMLFLGILLLNQALWGQVVIKGRVTSKTGEALARINIMLYLPGNTSLIAFAVSDEQGNFHTNVKADSDSLFVKVSSVNYRNENKHIINASQTLQFQLTEDAKQLEGISVFASPITKRGDTLSYLVSSFAKSEDRAIDDVLRRMPGIEVTENGQILYQGTAINKFYVEGLDLMEGRYGLVTKNLPKGSVSAVEILENHQPLRMLDGKVESQQAALNLKIKKGVTTTGKAQLGAGFSPFLWDVNITPMTFTKNFQVVTSLQSNNTGNDVSQQLKVFTFDELKRSSERPSERVEILNILSATPPEIKPERYLDNNIFLINFNGLQRLNSDFRLRSNIYYTYDYKQSASSLIRTMFTPTDTLQFSEIMDNQLHTSNLYAKFNLNRNVKNNYLNNDFKIQSSWDKRSGLINSEGEKIVQTLSSPLKSISNELRSYNPIGKHILEFQSYISFDDSPHSLAVSPGQFKDILNNGDPYALVIQEVDLKRFYTDNSAGLVFGIKRLTISPRLGITYQQQKLLSNIFIDNNQVEIKLAPEYSNNLETKSTNAYLLNDIEYKLRKLTIQGTIAFNEQYVNAIYLNPDQGQKLSKFFNNNRISVTYDINGFWNLKGSWAYNKRLSNFDDIHRGFILKNYRNLSQNMVPFSTISTQQLSSSLSYRNQIISFFNTFSYLYLISQTNNTNNNLILSDGSSVVLTEFQPRTTNTHYLQVYSSKFFSKTKTTLSLHINYMQQLGKSVVNNELFSTTNKIILVKPEIAIRITQWMNLEYNIDANNIFTYVETVKKSKVTLAKHNLNFFIFPVKNQLINLTAEYYNHNNMNNLFVDLLYRYSFVKKKIDAEVKFNNIFNSRTYTSYLANAYSVFETTYLLRPFQVIFSVKFNF
jgi:hypothetical protein